MSSTPLPPTDEKKKEAQTLKNDGNAAFAKKEFSAAHSLYTQAIALTPTVPALYSNRAAALLSMNQLPLALNDANRAIQLDPKWSKAYRRKASVLDAMKKWDEAKEVYASALIVALEEAGGNKEAEEKARAEIGRLVEAIDKKMALENEKPPVITEETQPGRLVMAEVERRVKHGEPLGRWPPVGSCLRRIWIAEMQFRDAMEHLNEFRSGQIPGAPIGLFGIFGRVQTLEEVTTAILEDPRVARFSLESLDKIELCYRLEQQQRNAIGPNNSPEETIRLYKERLTNPPVQRPGMPTLPPGWDSVRPALQLSIRTALLNGIVKEILTPDDSVSEFRRTVRLIEVARATWPTTDGSIRGRTLEETFLRGCKVLLGEALLQSYVRSPPPTKPLQRAALQEIIDIGTWLISSFVGNSKPPESERRPGPHGEDGWWGIYYTHYAAPRAKGHMLKGFGYLQLGLTVDPVRLTSATGKSGPVTGDVGKLGCAAKEYITAASWLPYDDPERTHFIWYAIFAMVRRGAYYMGDLHILRSLAETAPSFYSAYFVAEKIKASHPGKVACAETLKQSQGIEAPETICSPLVEWGEETPVDQVVYQEVVTRWMQKAVNGKLEEGLGLVALTEVMRGVWRERVEVWGEREEVVTAGKVWGGLNAKLKKDWDRVLEIIKKEKARK
ncbi:hypothetical protein RUND412_010781 [Rhizina undulata]